MGQVVTRNTRLTTGQALDALMERISSLVGPTPTQQLFRHVRWVLARGIWRLTDIGVDGSGGRLSGLVSFTCYLVLSHAISDVSMQGPLLLKNLREAVNMAKQCEDTCKDFEKHRPPAMVHEWKMMKRRWEVDPSQPDPYQIVEKGKTTVHTTSSILTPGFCSIESQCCKTKACGDRSARVQVQQHAPTQAIPLLVCSYGA